jgi:hypothetical protein
MTSGSPTQVAADGARGRLGLVIVLLGILPR